MAPLDHGVLWRVALPWENEYDFGPNRVGQAMCTAYAQFAQQRISGYLIREARIDVVELPGVTVHATRCVVDVHWEPRVGGCVSEAVQSSANDRAADEGIFNKEARKIGSLLLALEDAATERTSFV